MSEPIKRQPDRIYFSKRFYLLGGIISILFISSWLLNISLEIPILVFVCFLLFLFGEAISLFLNKKGITIERLLPERFSNGDFNEVKLTLTNHFPFKATIEIIEEFPEQFEIRNLVFEAITDPKSTKEIYYKLKPTERGSYDFGYSRVFATSPIGLVQRAMARAEEKEVKVYPSFIQMRKYELLAQSNKQSENGSRQLRKIGHSLEFEQIKEYIAGDDIRSINWKATARKNNLMVNHFIDEKSQQVYVAIDKGRLMKMPFNGLTLLDYAINATLVLCNVCLHKQDKFGLLTYANKPGTVVPAQKNAIQLGIILESLYKQTTGFLESDLEKLYLQVRTYIKQRGLLVLFTQFESMGGMKRQLPYLKQLAKHHLLMVIFFENTELVELSNKNTDNLEGIYTKTIAEKFVYEKKMIVKELQQHGILAILTAPEKLTIQVVNKYLELKTKQAI